MLLTSVNNSVNIFYPDEKKSRDLRLEDIVSLTFMSRESTLFYINKDNYIIMNSSADNAAVVSDPLNPSSCTMHPHFGPLSHSVEEAGRGQPRGQEPCDWLAQS